jgi:hypothetical protein
MTPSLHVEGLAMALIVLALSHTQHEVDVGLA